MTQLFLIDSWLYQYEGTQDRGQKRCHCAESVVLWFSALLGSVQVWTVQTWRWIVDTKANFTCFVFSIFVLCDTLATKNGVSHRAARTREKIRILAESKLLGWEFRLRLEKIKIHRLLHYREEWTVFIQNIIRWYTAPLLCSAYSC